MTKASKRRRSAAKAKPAPSAGSVAEGDKRLARGVAAVLSFIYDVAPQTMFRVTRGGSAESELRQVMAQIERRAAQMIGDDISIQRLGRGLERDRTTIAHALHKIAEASEGSRDVDVFIETIAWYVSGLYLMQKLAADAIAKGIDAARADEAA